MPGIDKYRGRTRRPVSFDVIVGVNPTRVLPADPTRVAIVFSSVPSIFTLGPDANVTGTLGLRMPTNISNVLYFDVETYGQWVTGEIWANVASGPAHVSGIYIVDTEYDGSQFGQADKPGPNS
jgi:hypothetical protein